MLDLVREFGPLTVAVGFFIWRDWKREERTSLQNEVLNSFIRSEMTSTLQENTEALQGNSQMLNRLANHCMENRV